jgi:amino acid permease
MLNIVNSLSVGTGALVVMVLSAALALPAQFIASRPVRYVTAIVVAFAVAYLLYWSPAWLGGDKSEFSGWAFAFIPIWFIAGCVGSVVVTWLLERRTAHGQAKHS